MNPFVLGKTWIDILLNPALSIGMRGYRQSKHIDGSKPSPNAAEIRRQRNKRQRDARRDHYRRMK